MNLWVCMQDGMDLLVPDLVPALWNARVLSSLLSSTIWRRDLTLHCLWFALFPRSMWWIDEICFLAICNFACLCRWFWCLPLPLFTAVEREALACCTTLPVAPTGPLVLSCIILGLTYHPSPKITASLFFCQPQSLVWTFVSLNNGSSPLPHRPSPTLIWPADIIF